MSPLWGCTREQAWILKLRHLTCRPNGSLAEWSWGLCSSVLRVIIKPLIGQRWGSKQEYHLFPGFFSCITAWGLLVARGQALAWDGWEDTKQFNKSFYGRFLLVNPHALRRLPCPMWPVSDQLTVGSGLLRVQAWLKPQDLLGPSSHTVLSDLSHPVPHVFWMLMTPSFTSNLYLHQLSFPTPFPLRNLDSTFL